MSLIIEKGRLYSALAEQATLIERQNRELLGQLEMARQFQRSMIPSEWLQLPGLRLAFVYRPALQVGGDILDVLPLSGAAALVFVGDAAGHGVHAAMVMAVVQTALLRASHATADPAELLRQINDELCEVLVGERYVTAVCAHVDMASHTACLALAGHVVPVHFSAGGEVTRPGVGLPLGVRVGAPFSAVTCPFAPGDTLVFFTDGITESQNMDADLYGEERFIKLVRQHGRGDPADLLHAVEGDLEKHSKQHEQADDQTVLVIRSVRQE